VEKDRSRERLRLSNESAGDPRETGEKIGRVCGRKTEFVTGEAPPDCEADEAVVAEEESEAKTLLALLMVLNLGGGSSSI
jgi:hypothetical protein